MDSTWMAFASLLFQLGLLIALIVCCLLVTVFIKEVTKKFNPDLRNRTTALLGGFIFASCFLVYSVFNLKGSLVTQMFVIGELIGFLGRFGVFSLIVYYILGRISESTK